MSAYVVASIDESDPETFERYREAALPVVAAFGGRSLIQGTRHECIEGSWRPRRLVIIEFPSVEQARRWYDSPEYQHAKRLRDASAVTDMLLFEGR